ncbi:tetratricopeptide repeat protein [Acetobacter sp. AAB5]|uniref:tetratricopeptide repeat protein n=1 Tax=Acetobacter sp. AAB5 TaxID=3418370 RepID=UPI003CED3DC8
MVRFMKPISGDSTFDKNCPEDKACHSVSTVNVQLMLGQIYLNNGKFSDAFSMFEVAARSGDSRALNMLGRAYERGWGVKCNASIAAMYFSHAAFMGEGWAMFNLADLYLAGKGVKKDPQKAYHLYILSAQHGVSKAFNMLGLIIEDGLIPELDRRKSIAFFRAAIKSEDCWGYLNMARYHLLHGEMESALLCLEGALDFGFEDVFRAMEKLLYGIKDKRFCKILERAKERFSHSCESV